MTVDELVQVEGVATRTKSECGIIFVRDTNTTFIEEPGHHTVLPYISAMEPHVHDERRPREPGVSRQLDFVLRHRVDRVTRQSRHISALFSTHLAN